MIRFVLFTVCFLLLIVCQAPAQSAEENQCLFSEVPENQNAR